MPPCKRTRPRRKRKLIPEKSPTNSQQIIRISDNDCQDADAVFGPAFTGSYIAEARTSKSSSNSSNKAVENQEFSREKESLSTQLARSETENTVSNFPESGTSKPSSNIHTDESVISAEFESEVNELDTSEIDEVEVCETKIKQKRKQYSVGFKIKVLTEAKKTSNRNAARLNSIDESLIRDWRKNEEKLRKAISNQKNISAPKRDKRANINPRIFRVGSGRKVQNEELEEVLYQWIIGRRSERKHVTMKMIQKEAVKIFDESESNHNFSASNGWCQNFMKRYSLTTRQKTHQSQRLPDEVIPKVVNFFKYIRKYFARFEISEDQVCAMDETNVQLENVSNKTINPSGNFFVLKPFCLVIHCPFIYR